MSTAKTTTASASSHEDDVKMNKVNENTTTSAKAAYELAQIAASLRRQLDRRLTELGMPENEELIILRKLGVIADTSTALHEFLNETAAHPAPAPEPSAVPVPAAVV
jgi:hypothetical protein